MAVHHRLDLGTGLIDLAVDKAFEIEGATLGVDRIAVAVEFHDVGRGRQARRHAPRQQEMLGILVMARTDVAEPVDHTLVVEDAIGGDEIVDQCGVGQRCLRARCGSHGKPR